MTEIRTVYSFIKNMFPRKSMLGIGMQNILTLEPFLSTGWNVTVFEPDQIMINLLENVKRRRSKIKIKMNGTLTIHPYAVSNRTLPYVPFYTSNVSRGISSIIPFHNSHVYKYDVNSVRLDDFYKNKSFEVNLMYVHTRGNDLNALLSYPWDSYKPDVIICEIDDNKTERLAGYTWKKIASFLQSAGYNIIISEWYPIVEYGQKHQWRCFKLFPSELNDKNGWGKLICFKNKKLFDMFVEKHIK